MPATLVDPEKILKDLRNLWDRPGARRRGFGRRAARLRMTLVVVADRRRRHATNCARLLGVLMHDHPSRAIVLKLDGKPGLKAPVFSQCWMPFGKHQQICAEGIEITAGAAELAEVAQLLLPLIVSDLPVVLWCRGPRVFCDHGFAPLLPLVQKIIVDSTTVQDPYAAVAAVRGLRKQGRLVADLSWTKLTGLRELIASLFDEGTAANIKSAQDFLRRRRAHGQRALFLKRGCSMRCPRLASRWNSAAKGTRSIRSIVLEGDCEVTLTRPDKATMEVHCRDRVRRSSLVLVSEETLMSEELSILGPDPVFDKVLA